MKPQSGESKSVWAAGVEIPVFEPLATDIEADVCVIGAGIAGITTAYLLARSGKQVIVIDDGVIAGGETHRTTAHLSNVLDDRYSSCIKQYGVEKASLVYQSHSAAINLIESLVREESIDCQFKRVNGYLFAGEHGGNSVIKSEIEAAHKIGFAGAQLLSSAPSLAHKRQAIVYPAQGQFHVLQYISGLARTLQKYGGKIFTSTHAAAMQEGPVVSIKTRNGARIRCAAAVVATNTPVFDLVAIHTKQHAYRTYVIAGYVPRGSVEPALYWDTNDPYHYVRLTDAPPGHDGELLIVGGEDHRTGQHADAERAFANLFKWTRNMFTQFKNIEYSWSGQVMETVDGLAFIGRDPGHRDNIFVATGDSGMGMTHGTIAGMLLTDLINDNPNPWADIYAPDRKPTGSALHYAAENINVAMQYSDYLRGSQVKSAAEVEPGQGAVIKINGKHVAVYRGDDNQIIQCSAVCPHMKALVRWNDLEKTWDCPAHGSRFSATGDVLNGPANRGLERLSEQDISDSGQTSLPLPPPGDSGIEHNWPGA